MPGEKWPKKFNKSQGNEFFSLPPSFKRAFVRHKGGSFVPYYLPMSELWCLELGTEVFTMKNLVLSQKAEPLALTLACTFVPAVFKQLFMLFADFFTVVTIGTGSIFLFVIAYAFIFTCFIMTILSGCLAVNKIVPFIMDKEYRKETINKMPEFIKRHFPNNDA